MIVAGDGQIGHEVQQVGLALGGRVDRLQGDAGLAGDVDHRRGHVAAGEEEAAGGFDHSQAGGAAFCFGAFASASGVVGPLRVTDHHS